MDSQAEEIFAQAVELEPDKRAALLDSACGADITLRRKVEEMLRDAALADAFFGGKENPAPAGGFTEKEGNVIGAYTLREKLGEGGFGEVWMAEQRKPISRMVALKVIKAGMDTREFLARFESERQALAMMDHPNIAKVLDAGATTTGRPWFSMELVRGVPITRYCDEARLSVRERLELFADVCSAISHAHQKGVIHRDIKPSNVLVTVHVGKPVVKIIDFGIAKAVQGRLTEHTLHTRVEHFLGTPAYMSPEQARNLDIDTRSDIYALGILLYELLVGQPPFDSHTLQKAGYDEMRRVICEVEPARPSTRIGTTSAEEKTRLAATRSVSPEKIRTLIASDLDWIALKALEKDRARRYPTADELARDIVHYLTNEPVSATPPSAGYVFGKFARRHRIALRVAASVTALLVAATAVSAWLAIRARHAERLASQRLGDSEAISKFLTEIFQSADPQRAGRDVTVAETLDTAVTKLDTSLADQPERRAKLLDILADTYTSLGLYAKGLETRRKAFDLLSRTLGEGNIETFAAAHRLSESLMTSGYYEDAVKLNEKALALSTRQDPGGRQAATALADLANAYLLAGRSDQARETGERALALSRKWNGAEATATQNLMELLIDCYQRLNQPDNAETMKQELIARTIKLPGMTHPATVRAREMSGTPPVRTEEEQDARFEREIKAKEQALDKARAEHGAESIAAFEAMTALAYAYFCVPSKSTPLPPFEGRRADAINLQEKVLALARKIYGPTNKVTLDALETLTYYNFRTKDRPQTYDLQDELAELQIQVFGPESVEAGRGKRRQAAKAWHLREKEKAIGLSREAVRILSQTLGVHNRETADARSVLGTMLVRMGQAPEGLEILTDCGADMRDDTWVNGRIAALQAWFGQEKAYDATRNWMIDWGTGEIPTLRSHRADMFDRIVRLSCLRPFASAAQQKAVMAILRRSIEMRAKLGTADQNIHRLALGMAQYRSGAFSESEITMAGLARSQRSQGDLGDTGGLASFYEAMALFQQGKREKARDVFAAAVKDTEPLPPLDSPITENSDVDPYRLGMLLAHIEAQDLITGTTAPR